MPKAAPHRARKSAATPTTERTTVPLDRIHLSPLNPRTEFPLPGIRDLAATIERDGLIQALTVRPSHSQEGKFEIAAGERRFRALQHLRQQGKIAADWPVPVQVREMDDQELLTLALVENLLREDLHPLDEAYAYQRLAEAGVTTAEIARRVRRTQRHVQLRLKLTGLDPRVQKAFRHGEITLAQARALSTAPPELHVPAFEAFLKWPNLYQDPANLMGLLTRDSFPQARAAFSPREYTGPVIEDPETGERHYADLGQVQRLQARAAERMARELEKGKGRKVDVVEGSPETVWTRYRPAPSGRGSHAVVVVAPSGELTVLDDLAPLRKTGTPRAASPPAEEETEGEEKRPLSLLTEARKLRNGAVQQAVASDAAAALRLLLVGLLQRPWSFAGGLSFSPTQPPPGVSEDASAAAVALEELRSALGGEKALPPPPTTGAGLEDPLSLLAEPKEVARIFKALLEVPDETVVRLLTRVVAARTGSSGVRPEEPALLPELARALTARVESAAWLRREFLELYRTPHLIRIAADSGAVPRGEADSLSGLSKDEVIDRILGSDTRDPDYLPPELRFE